MSDGRPDAPPTPAEFAELIDPNLRWADIERFATELPLPVIVKGILTPEDALLAAEHGARGIVVSNHGGRQLDTVPASADALAPVVDAVGDRLEVIVDGGIRRGTDVLKALALGARAVMVGRPLLWGLAVGGADGAQRVLEILLDEFDPALALAGVPRAADLDRQLDHSRAVARRAAMNILVTGVTGYVGSRLVPRLQRDGHTVRGFARSSQPPSLGIPTLCGDAVSGRGLDEALDGIEVAYFLIHSMEPAAATARSASASGRRRRTSRAPRSARVCGASSTWAA